MDPLDTVTLSARLADVTYLVGTFAKQNDEEPTLIGWGTAVAISPEGNLLTAAHVLADLPTDIDHRIIPNGKGTWQRITEYFKELHLHVLVRKPHNQLKFIDYGVDLWGIFLIDPNTLVRPLMIDLAILRPKKLLADVPFLRMADYSPPVGTRVLMAGFTEETDLPYRMYKSFNLHHPDDWPVGAILENTRHQLFIRSAIVGSCRGFSLQSADRSFSGSVFYIDNAAHKGASGGPVIDENGLLVGIITGQPLVPASGCDAGSIYVPSGAAIAITPSYVQPLLPLDKTS